MQIVQPVFGPRLQSAKSSPKPEVLSMGDQPARLPGAMDAAGVDGEPQTAGTAGRAFSGPLFSPALYVRYRAAGHSMVILAS